ncbi:MAG: glycoside hydrolase family 2 protein, partial [Bacteroidales bacterium]|nr:glycoside hydrolase family 2 protein [Bacteroidales bacterium]
EHAGRTGGLPFVGAGWYRNSFDVANFSANRKVTIQFDGAMSNAEVYVNGEKAGIWPNGYNTFHFDITDLLNKNGKNNVLAVRLENFSEQSRWYPGAGLYRNVHVIVTNESRIPVWGTYVTTPRVNEEFAEVNVKTQITFPEDAGSFSDYELETVVKDIEGNPIAQQVDQLGNFDENQFNQSLIVMNPVLWDIEQPNLYSVESTLRKSGDAVDSYNTTFGIRDIKIIPDEGFFLNGRMVKFKGVCMHHDLGPLGGAVNDAAIRRQIRILQDMGVNAIRTAHNMPAPELIKAADEMGMMIAVETFDEWGIAKVSNGYNKYFDEWAEKDVVNVVQHFRNNPSVVMWFIGNEVEEQSVMWGARRARFLQDIIQREDPTRFVSNGMDRPDAVYNNGMAAVMEVAGFNYRPFRYKEAYGRLPQQIILGAETASTVSSRGVYKFPVARKSMATYEDHQSSSYDVEHCSWSDLPEDNFVYHDDLDYCIGEFVWTGFDYLGEPTPYYTNWPSHSSLFGIVDLAGIPKDRFYLYRSQWAPEKETLHILPHWTWEGREGETTPVFVYTNHPTVELFINGVSQGKRTKETSIGIDSTFTEEAQKDFERQKRYRLMWMDTKYEPGTVKAVAYDANGNEMGTEEVHTAGEPHSLVLEADRNKIKADGKDLSFITVSVVDKDGNLCPHADDLVKFNVKGKGTYRAGANGNSASLDLLHEPQMHFFSGQLTAIVESLENEAGTITLEASANGVKAATIDIETTL